MGGNAGDVMSPQPDQLTDMTNTHIVCSYQKAPGTETPKSFSPGRANKSQLPEINVL